MNGAAGTVAVAEQEGQTTFSFAGTLRAAEVGTLWRPVRDAMERARGRRVVLDLADVALIDTAGATFLLGLAGEGRGGEEVAMRGAAPHVAALLDRIRPALRAAQAAPAPQVAPVALRALAGGVVRAAADGIAFGGEAAVAVATLPRRRRMLRGRDLLRYADQAGARAVPLVVLLGFLMGLILAFQSSVPLRRFGADLYVANLVSISMLRELGPLLAAVILAGRTGSAFAAEIGTMKVNEEVNALMTMGLDPMTMLVLPRLIAATLVMPAITLVLDIAGLLGMTVVMLGFGFPLVSIANQVARAAHWSDLLQGLFKAVCFGAAIAALGCREGLGTGAGPRAVGLSATGAVVGGIVAVVALDGLFALLFYRIGL